MWRMFCVIGVGCPGKLLVLSYRALFETWVVDGVLICYRE